MKYIGVDYGSKRIGLAISDETNTLAFPLEVVKNEGNYIEIILKHLKDNGVETIVLGESKDLSGKDNKIMREILEFKEKMKKNNIEVIMEREYMTSMHVQGDREKLDASSASLILQRYLDKKKYGNNR